MASQVFDQFFSAHVLSMATKQRHLHSVIGDSGWDVDLGQGQLSFAGVGYGLEVLGTQSDGDNSWLWGWANAASGLPEHVLTRSRQLPKLAGGNVPELIDRSFSQDIADGHQLAVVAGGLLGADAYYRCPYEGGQLFVLLFDSKLAIDPKPLILDFTGSVMFAIDAYQVPDHRLAISAYARTVGLDVTESDDDLQLSGQDGSATVEFLDNGRLSKINSDLKAATRRPADAASKKRGFFRRKS